MADAHGDNGRKDGATVMAGNTSGGELFTLQIVCTATWKEQATIHNVAWDIKGSLASEWG